MQRSARNRLQSDEIVLVELWNPVGVEGFVEYSFSGPFATPVFLIPTDAESAGQAMALNRSNTEIYPGLRQLRHP
jgi:hypothetical protein